MSENGRFYWLKLKRDFFKRHDIRIIESMPNGKDYILFYLKLLCESVDHEGNLRFSEQIPYNEEMLATITNTNVDIVRSAIKIFTELNMMEILDDGTFFMSEVNRMIGSAVDNDNANRQRRFRENQKSLALRNITESVTECNESVTENNACVTEAVTNNNESKSKSKSKREELEIEKESKKETIDEILSSVPAIDNDPDLKKTFYDYIEMRKMIKKPITGKALKLAINKAYEYGGGDPDRMQKIIEQSILNSWQGIFPLKQDDQNKHTDGSISSRSEYVNPFTQLRKEEGYE